MSNVLAGTHEKNGVGLHQLLTFCLASRLSTATPPQSIWQIFFANLSKTVYSEARSTVETARAHVTNLLEPRISAAIPERFRMKTQLAIWTAVLLILAWPHQSIAGDKDEVHE